MVLLVDQGCVRIRTRGSVHLLVMVVIVQASSYVCVCVDAHQVSCDFLLNQENRMQLPIKIVSMFVLGHLVHRC